MSSQRVNVDDELYSWNDIEGLGWSGILIGNGASLAVWDLFRYRSLYEQAKSGAIGHSLLPEEQGIFEALGTTNFEQVLASLATAKIVGGIFGLDVTTIQTSYERAQFALAEAIHAIHVPWPCVPESVFKEIRMAVLPFDFVYSTNYDLIVYWSIMADNARGFKDYFWGGKFNLADTQVWDKCTKILYLHGALHLYRLPSGETFKHRAEPLRTLLDLFGASPNPEAIPLIVTEGTSKDKLTSIYHSDYLSFAYSQFSQSQGPLVVFGHSLSDSDAHLVEAMRRWGNTRIAVSVRRGAPREVIARKAELQRALPDAILMFFDAETHPLGKPALKIDLNHGSVP